MRSNEAEPLDVLLIESIPGVGCDQVRDLVLAGHRVHRCWDDSAPRTESTPLCVGVTRYACPLDRGIDVALLVREAGNEEPSHREIGATCALTSGVPLMAVGHDRIGPYGPWLSGHLRDDGVVVACEQVARRARRAAEARASRMWASEDHSDPYVEMMKRLSTGAAT